MKSVAWLSHLPRLTSTRAKIVGIIYTIISSGTVANYFTSIFDLFQIRLSHHEVHNPYAAHQPWIAYDHIRKTKEKVDFKPSMKITLHKQKNTTTINCVISVCVHRRTQKHPGPSSKEFPTQLQQRTIHASCFVICSNFGNDHIHLTLAWFIAAESRLKGRNDVEKLSKRGNIRRWTGHKPRENTHTSIVSILSTAPLTDIWLLRQPWALAK